MFNLINSDSATPGIFRARILMDGDTPRVYVPGITNISKDSNSENFADTLENNKELLPKGVWCAYNLQSTREENLEPLMWVMFEGGDSKRPVIISYTAIGGSGSGSTHGNLGGLLSSVPIALKEFIGSLENITLNDLQSLEGKGQYLELVMPLFKKLCAESLNGRNVVLKYPGVLALQPFFEVSANFPKTLSNVAKSDNNLGGLKYNSSIPYAKPGSAYPKSEGNGVYCRFDNISQYFYAQVYNAKGSLYSLSHSAQTNVVDYTRAFLNVWVTGNINDKTVPTTDVSYSANLIKMYNEFGLSKYEN